MSFPGVSFNVRDWLPVEALAGTGVRAAVADAVGAWSAAWFPRQAYLVASLKPVAAGSAPIAAYSDWRVYRAAAAIACPHGTGAALVAAALDAKPGQGAATGADRELLAGFESRLLADLALKLEQALGIAGTFQDPPRAASHPYGPLGGLAIGLTDEAGANPLALALPLPALVPFVKNAMPPAPVRRPAPSPLAPALGATRVALEATLGEAELAFGDLRALAPGDVLLLDTSLGQPAALALRGRPVPVARGSLGEQAGRLTLTLQA
jgi:hypothetical protein